MKQVSGKRKRKKKKSYRGVTSRQPSLATRNEAPELLVVPVTAAQASRGTHGCERQEESIQKCDIRERYSNSVALRTFRGKRGRPSILRCVCVKKKRQKEEKRNCMECFVVFHTSPIYEERTVTQLDFTLSVWEKQR